MKYTAITIKPNTGHSITLKKHANFGRKVIFSHTLKINNLINSVILENFTYFCKIFKYT